MILAAGLLVLLGLGLFVAGILTGMTALYWACVAVCVVAAVLLALTRRQMGAATRAEAVAAPAAPVTPVSPGDGPAREPGSGSPPPRAVDDRASDAAAVVPAGATAASVAAEPEQLADPPVEEVEVTDLLMVVDLTDEVLVVDERPRYHLAGCVHLSGRTAIPLPLDEARTDGFTPCAVCAPDRTLAQRARERRAGRSG
ncbi:hypothetical protein [Blastococcus mobilis]|uniref:Uncharacterized protein n=1 Tax=Blastococcus mobilis TaxID=1938746 RepID=A0A238VHJ1_9ACTN|nr:hypothetical protein [Blastococcus mobilis]SNR33658.1 hypothetical protein SAMN06272737_103165 [Blastococcus mobilis]